MAKDDAYHLQNFAILTAFLSAGIFYYWVAFPVVNSRMQNEGPNGIPVSHRNGLLWWNVFLLFFFGLLPIVLLLLVMVPNSLLRADIHLLLCVLVTLLVIVAGLGVLFIWLFYCNTSLSADATMCNAPDYCCVYGPSVPAECPQPALPCVPPKERSDLNISHPWNMHGWMALGFLLFTLVLHWPLNYNVRVSGYANASSKRESLVLAALLIFITAGIFYWFAAWIVPNVQFISGWPLFAIPPSPGPFVSYLYKLQWISVYTLSFNWLPILLLAMALLYKNTTFVGNVHLQVSIIMTVFNVVILAYYIVVIVLFTNGHVFNSTGSISNDDDYCCERFTDKWCPNVGPCTPPNPRTLSVNPVFVQLTVSSALFVVTGIFHTIMNSRFRMYGVME